MREDVRMDKLVLRIIGTLWEIVVRADENVEGRS